MEIFFILAMVFVSFFALGVPIGLCMKEYWRIAKLKKTAP
jgi:hypothetical protein